MKKKNYQVTLNGETFTRKSHREYESAGGFFHKTTGKVFYNVAFAGPGKNPNPARPSEKPSICLTTGEDLFPGMPLLRDYDLVTARVKIL